MPEPVTTTTLGAIIIALGIPEAGVLGAGTAAGTAAGAGAAAGTTAGAGISLIGVGMLSIGGIGLTALVAILVYNAIHSTNAGEERTISLKTSSGEANLSVKRTDDSVKFSFGKDCSMIFGRSVLEKRDHTENLVAAIQAFAAVAALSVGTSQLNQSMSIDGNKAVAKITYQSTSSAISTNDIAELLMNKNFVDRFNTQKNEPEKPV